MSAKDSNCERWTEPQDPAQGVAVGTQGSELRHDGTNLSAPVGQFAVQVEFKFASLKATCRTRPWTINSINF